MQLNKSSDRVWRFGPFVLRESQRRLERHEQPVRLGSRSFGLLLELLKRAGEVVSKAELLAAVWSDVVVDEASVRVHMSILRKVLGRPGQEDGCVEWITNIPLRGYRFLGRVDCEFGQPIDAVQAARSTEDEPDVELPALLSNLVGRSVEVEQLLEMLTVGRLVTVTGTGGVGKTSVAIRAAEHYRQRHHSRVRLVDLAPLTSQGHVLTTVARSIGVRADGQEVEQAIIRRLENEDALLLVDNCEHVIATLAPLAYRLLAALPNLRILSTSRETLGIAGERVLRLLPLAVHDRQPASLGRALQSPAVQLLLERATAAGAEAFDDASSGPLTSICQQVDGIPLAIELVATRLAVQSASDLSSRLDGHMRLHSARSRAVLPRQRTLAATLAWSVDLLNESELLLFRRLSIFRSRFGVEAAVSIVSGEMEHDVASDALIALARKSLVVFDANNGTRAPYRLLDTTRSYAQVLLVRADERELVSRRHARLILELMERATADLATLDAQDWTQRYGSLLDDVRAAMDASIAQTEDTEIVGALATASGPLWFRLSEVSEYRGRIEMTLNYVNATPGSDRMTTGRLLLALYNALWHTGGTVADMTQTCERALAIALEFKSETLEFQARWGLCALNITRGDYSSALRHAKRLSDFASQSENDATRNLSHRMLALASHFCGAFAEAKLNAVAAMNVGGLTRRNHANALQPDARTTAMAILARTLWIQGDDRLAMTTAARCFEEAEALAHAMSLSVALFWICPVAIWAGEQRIAREWVDRMLRETSSKAFAYWHDWALCYDDALKVSEVADRSAYIQKISNRLSTMDDARIEMLATFVPEWVTARLVARANRGEGQWSAAEVFRAAGLCQERQGNEAAAKALYLRALDVANEQGARGWELRAAQTMRSLLDEVGGRHGAVLVIEDACDARPPDIEGLALTAVRDVGPAG